jgi:transcriptional regulator with XRE-family HTH domain
VIQGIGERIHAARESKGLTKVDVAKRIGISDQWVYDLETYDDDLPSTLSLQQVCDLAAVLSQPSRDLVCGSDLPATDDTTTAAQVAAAINAHLSKNDLDPDNFGERVGWDVRSVIQEPNKLWADWNLDCLRDVCGEVGIDWRTVLPSKGTDA